MGCSRLGNGVYRTWSRSGGRWILPGRLVWESGICNGGALYNSILESTSRVLNPVTSRSIVTACSIVTSRSIVTACLRLQRHGGRRTTCAAAITGCWLRQWLGTWHQGLRASGVKRPRKRHHGTLAFLYQPTKHALYASALARLRRTERSRMPPRRPGGPA
eukprot:SAG11_NODE_2555_length_3224_cov_2.896640_3_plen_161_part_00